MMNDKVKAGSLCLSIILETDSQETQYRPPHIVVDLQDRPDIYRDSQRKDISKLC